MKIGVAGLWHLGLVTAACLAKAGFDVIAYDPDQANIKQLQTGHPPIFELGLTDLLQKSSLRNQLTYTTDPHDLGKANIVWITFDTPVDHQDLADVEAVRKEIEKLLPALQDNSLIIISSQMPVGTTQALQKFCQTQYPNKHFSLAYIPENLRLGKAIEIFTHPDRIIIGIDNERCKNILTNLLKPFSNNLIWMSIVSAEMTKHAINAFLALSVTFINELATLCESVGANGWEVEQGLKSEERIGPKAYLRPGGAIAGGTLLRDIHYLTQLGQEKERDTFLLSAIKDSNRYHQQWSCRKLLSILKNLQGKRITMLGLTYKANTDTLRRSSAIETSQWLHQQGAHIIAFDPAITALPAEYQTFIEIKQTIQEALKASDAVLISTEWPQFRELSADDFILHAKQALVLDPSGYTAKNIGNDSRIKYFSVGVPS